MDLDQNLSKKEQISNWQLRPLRKSQMHYAAADAFVPLLIKNKINDYFMKFVSVIEKVYFIIFQNSGKRRKPYQRCRII